MTPRPRIVCCTTIEEERSDSPDLPSPRAGAAPHTLPLVHLPDEYPLPNSRYTSVGTEDLRDIQRIFQEANSAEVEHIHGEDSGESLKNSPRKSVIGSLFRKTLLRTKSRSTGILLSDADEIKRTKSELRQTLLLDQGREAGGYDSDAAALDDVEASVTQIASNLSPERGRDKLRLQGEDWPQR
jgi:hypothetical protein